jgi:Protein kinase domain
MQPQLIAGRYQVLRAIGRGGMGTVWLCRDEVLGREVAAKQIGALPGESATQTKRAMREARSAAALNHPNAVAVYDVVDHDGRPWLIMEYVEGQTLADEISRDGRLSPERVADIGAQLAGALARAHERGIVHRDIKPGNVLIDQAGRPKISDFGIARGHGDEQLTQVGFITGTPGYLSPELARGGDPLPSSDVWALGATLYTAVEGQAPYEPRSNPLALLRAIAAERPRAMTHAGALAPAIDAMMDEDPACRWDMATSSKRLGAMARTAAVMPRVLARTAVIPAPPLEPTQALGPTQPMEVAAPVVAAPISKPPVIKARVTEPRVTEPRVAPAGAAGAPVVAAPISKPPVIKARVTEPLVAPAGAARAPVVAAPISKPPAAPVVVARAPAVAASVDTDHVSDQGVTKLEVAQTRAVEPSMLQVPPVVAAAARQPEPIVPHDVLVVPHKTPNGRRRSRRWLPLVFAAVLVALGLSYLMNQVAGPGGSTAGTTITRGNPKATVAPKVVAPPSATTSVPPRVTAAPTPKAGQGLEGFLQSYYSAVTRDTGRTWGQLTPTMQQAAGGRAGYDGWWRTISKVKVNWMANASATRADANLTFTRNDGTTSTENHQFTFVTQGGVHRINSDRLMG